MATLVIDTATTACSVALLDGGAVVDERHDVVGRGHAERLIPMIGELLHGRVPDAIWVDCGPGSFTGVRVGLAAARGLALAWGVPLHGYSSLALVAAGALAHAPGVDALAVVLEGGHGEVFMQCFDRPLAAQGPLQSLVPDAALAALARRPAFGSGVRHLLALNADVAATEALPRAADAVLLPLALRDLPPSPIYGRAPDAKPIAARA